MSRAILMTILPRSNWLWRSKQTNATDVPRRAAMRALIASHHFCKEFRIVVAFSGHLFADRVQFFEKSWTRIHFRQSDHSSLTRNSGVTISGTKKPAAVLKSLTRAWR